MRFRKKKSAKDAQEYYDNRVCKWIEATNTRNASMVTKDA